MDHFSLSSFTELMQRNETAAILKCNEYTSCYGVSLTEEDVRELAAFRKETLKSEERLELGKSILKKLIYEFCDSPYIYQANYAETLGELQRIFYLYKNECMDAVSDDELLTVMKQAFDGSCEGSLENLEDTVLQSFARNIRDQSPFSDADLERRFLHD